MLKLNKNILVVFFIIINFIIIFVYPIIDDFSYYHMAAALKAEKSNFVDVGDSYYAGFYILTIVIHMLTNISYESLSPIPIMSFSLLILLILLFKYFFKYDNTYLLVVTIFITQSSINRYSLFPHNVGFILFLSYLVLFSFFNRKLRFRSIISILIVIIIISTNFISYKYTFLILSFNLFSYILQFLENHNENKIENKTNKLNLDLKKITLIGFVFTFSYNMWIYKSFIPKIVHQSELSSSSGIEKLAYGFSENREKISSYFFIRPPEIALSHTIWMILIIIILLLLIELFIRKMINKQEFSKEEKIILCLGISGITTFALYSSLGMAEIGIILITGFLGCGIMPVNRKKIVLIIIILLLILNIYINIMAVETDYYGGHKDLNNFEYLKPSIKWYINYTNKSAYIINDIFSDSYFIKETAERNISISSGLFTEDRILVLLEPDNSLPIDKVYKKDPRIRYYNLINYREHYFSIYGWELFRSWINYKKSIEKNPYFETVYSSGDINILFRNPNKAIY